jgi:hypothetical protein
VPQLSTAPVHGSVHLPHVPEGHCVAGAQHWPFWQCVLPSPLLPQSLFFWPQSSVAPVHGSTRVSHSSSEQVDGVQHWFVSLPFVPQVWLAAHVPVQGITAPVQGSVTLPPHAPGGHWVSGVQHWLVSLPLVPHVCPEAHWLVQVRTAPVHGSVTVPPHAPGGHWVSGVQHWLVSLPFVPHVSAPHWLVHGNTVPVQGSVHVPPHCDAGQAVAGVQHVVFGPHTSLPQLPVQSSVPPVHGSLSFPQKPLGHVALEQHVPPTPHVVPPGALLQLFPAPQFTSTPLQSFFIPQSFGRHVGGHAQTLFVHTSLPGHAPQLTGSPHVFFTVPHLPVHAAGGGGGGHFAQVWRTLPQPSSIPPPGSHTPGPQVRGMQPHVFVVVSHGALPGHWVVPQSMVTPHPVIFPHLPVQSAAVGGTHAVHWWVVASQT